MHPVLLVGMARCAVPARAVAGGTVAPLNAARTAWGGAAPGRPTQKRGGAPPPRGGGGGDAEEGPAVGRVSAGQELLAITGAVLIEVAGAVAGERVEVGHFPIIIQTVAVGVSRA